jgi:hypothetical protein
MANLSISKAWDESSAFLKREMRLITPVALATFMIPATLFGWYNPSGDPNLASGGLGWPLTLVILILAMTGQMTIAGLAIGWSGSVGSALRHAFGRVWGLLATVLLLFIPMTVILILVIAVMVGGAGLTDPSQVTPEALAALPQVSFTVLIATLIFLFVAVRIFPLSAVAMTETANPIRLLARCWQLTRGHFLRLLGTLFLILIASFVASVAVTAVIGSVMTLVAGEPQPYNLSALIVALFDGVISAGISAISAVLVGRIYVQLSAGEASVPDVSREA